MELTAEAVATVARHLAPHVRRTPLLLTEASVRPWP